MRNKILIVDDEEDLREMLNYNLTKSMYEVIEASNGEEALDILEKESVDLVVLDIMMPGKDGYEVCKELRIKGNKVPILFLTAKNDDYDEILGLELGADDYIKKPFNLRALISRIRTILRRTEERNIIQNVITIEGLKINLDTYEVIVDDKKIFFPRKEFELLFFLASHPGRVFTRDFLLDQIWKEESYVVDRTVDVHIGRIRKKLDRYKDYIQTVVGVGYRFIEKY
jgi:two-component system alkaline phosphatase synthesis response regulator PhoP